MVASVKIKARAEFGRLFNAELDRVEAPKARGRVAWVHKHLKENQKELVSYEQVRKYVRGKDMPEQANLWIICQRLGLDWTRLSPMVSNADADQYAQALWELWPRLDDDTKRDLVGAARVKAKSVGELPFKRDPPNAAIPAKRA